MTSPLTLTVEEVAEDLGILADYATAMFLGVIAQRLNGRVESKRQAYMSTDRARAEYDPDGWRHST